MGRVTKDEGQPCINVLVVAGMAEFMEHGIHPFGIGLDVAEHPNIPFVVEVGTEGMLVFPLFFIKVALFKHVVNGEPDPSIITCDKGFKIFILVVFIKVHIVNLRRFLEKPVLIIPGHQLFLPFQVVILYKIGVDIPLNLGKCTFGKAVEFIENPADLPGILIAQGKAHFVVVPETKFFCNSIAHFDQLNDIRRNNRSDGFLRLPNLLLFSNISGVLQDIIHIIVGQFFPLYFSSEVAIFLLNCRSHTHHCVEFCRIGLCHQEGAVKDIQLAVQQTIGNQSRNLDLFQLFQGRFIGIKLCHLQIQFFRFFKIFGFA